MKKVLIIGIAILIILLVCLGFYGYTFIGSSKVDCSPAGQSADEYSFGKYIGPKKCCEGLIKIPVKVYENKSCHDLFDAGTVCSSCGNNICEEWENPCNCNKDCVN